MSFDASRLKTGHVVAAIGGAALFVFLFFDWFGGGQELVPGGPRDVPGLGEVPGPPQLKETGVSGWDALTDLPGFVIILSGLAALALAAMAGLGRRVNWSMPRGGLTAILGALATTLVLWKMVAGSPSLKIGVFLGLAATATLTIGALLALREEGFEPWVKVAGGRTRKSGSARKKS